MCIYNYTYIEKMAIYAILMLNERNNDFAKQRPLFF